MDQDRGNSCRCQWRRKRTRRRKPIAPLSESLSCSVIDRASGYRHCNSRQDENDLVPRRVNMRFADTSDSFLESTPSNGAISIRRDFNRKEEKEAQHDLISTNNSIKMLNNNKNNYHKSSKSASKLTNCRAKSKQQDCELTMISKKYRHKPTNDRLIFITLLMVTCCCLNLTSCQMRTSSLMMQNDQSQFLAPSSASSSPSPLIGRFEAEPRVLDQPLRTRNYDQLLVNNLLNQLNQNQRRVQPLPLSNQQQRAQATSQQQQAQFANSPSGNNFMPNRRPNFSQNTNNNNNQLGFVSSSPATPYLTLNRIANQQSLANNQNRPLFNQSPPQPINTIPLGMAAMNSNNNANSNRISLQSINNRLMPPQSRPQVQQNRNQLVGNNQVWTNQVSPPLQAQQGNSLQPLTGFAPSGPPPSSVSSNNALVVVQSPASNGQPAPQQVVVAGPTSSSAQVDANINENKTQASNEDKSPPATTTTISSDDRMSASSESTAAVAPDEKSNNQPATTLLPVPINISKQSTSTESAPASEPSSLEKNNTVTSISDEVDQSVSKDSNWNPVEAGNRTNSASNKNKVSLSPSLDIVTVPPGYNPDSSNSGPQNFDISVSAKMGGGNSQQQPPTQQQVVSSELSPSSTTIAYETSSSVAPVDPSLALPTVAPTAVTTIIWSPPGDTPTSTSSSSHTVIHPTKVLDYSKQAHHQSTSAPAAASQPNRIRDFSLNDEPASPAPSTPDMGVVYGKPQAKDSKPAPPLQPAVSPSPVTGQASFESSVPASGRPFIEPVQMDNQVRPYLAAPGAQPAASNIHHRQSSVLKSNHGHSPASSSSAPFRPSRPLHSTGVQSPPLHVGSGFTITANGNQTMPFGDIQDYVAGQPPTVFGGAPPSNAANGHNQLQVSDSNNEPTISAQGGQDPANFDLGAEFAGGPAGTANNPPPPSAPAIKRSGGNSSEPNSSSQPPAQVPPRIRRPTFKPKPAVPPIRIDSCIVGDDSSCDQSHNERCVTEYGISSCHCKPGYARLSQLRGYCNPVSSLQLNFKIDKLSDDRRLVYNQSLDNSNSEEYQYLEFETMQALAGAFQQTPLNKQFMGARVNKFFERKGKVWANVSVNFELNNLTRTDRIQNVATQELLKVSQANQAKPLGDSTIMLDNSREAISRLVDINECANKELNDCSKNAICINDFGGFQCQCLPGFEDKYQAEDKSKHGRVCLGCSASYCSNRGECSIIDGQKQCKCRANFIGDRCDYNSEILVLIIGCSLVCMIILIFTIWGLYFVNRRWKRHDSQPKLDAMSATSGLTYNYVNSSTNSLMSPTSRAMTNAGALHHRSGNQQVANYSQRFGAALAGGARGAPHYALDQQAIIGSTSSGSSASSQPIGCNPYAAAGQYQYDDGGLLIAPASTGSSEQTSPSDNSYRGIMAASGHQGGHSQTMLSQLAANAYTLSGHHHHHHHLAHHQMHQHHHQQQKHLSQFNPVADYRTMHCNGNGGNLYEQGSRWRTLQQESAKQSALVGYYLVRN